MSDFRNRVTKRHRHLSRWAERWPTEAWRLYDWDIPEWPWTVDVYGPHVLIQEYRRRGMSDEEREAQRAEVVDAVREVCQPKGVFTRIRVQQKGGAQYERQGDAQAESIVREGPLRFHVNLSDYIDTGLFLDHREQRRAVADHITSRSGRPGEVRFLNLFGYTAAFSVWAAHVGAHTTTVDLSNTYLEWAERNFELNNLDPHNHIFQRSDILRWLPREVELNREYEVIVLDPPTFSRSSSMERDLDVQRDHAELIERCLDLLTLNGKLYFSTNFRDFTLDQKLQRRAHEITSQTTPEDFYEGVHRSWEFSKIP